jgi:hypothetical protein
MVHDLSLLFSSKWLSSEHYVVPLTHACSGLSTKLQLIEPPLFPLLHTTSTRRLHDYRNTSSGLFML